MMVNHVEYQQQHHKPHQQHSELTLPEQREAIDNAAHVAHLCLILSEVAGVYKNCNSRIYL